MNKSKFDIVRGFAVWAVLLVAMSIGIHLSGNYRRANVYRNLGATNLLNGEFKKAITAYDEAIRLSPNNAMAYSDRGRAHVLNKDLDRGIQDFGEAIRLDPKDPKAYYARGRTYDAKGEYGKALTDYSEALRIDPKFTNCYVNRGLAFSKNGELDNAISDYNEALRIDPLNARALSSRGAAHKKKGEFGMALKDFKEAIRLNPMDGIAYNNLALFRSSCPDDSFRNGKEALELASKACELTQWKSWFCIATLGAAYAELGDFEQAVNYQKQALGMFGATEENRVGEQRRLDLYQQRKPYREVGK